MSETTHAPCPFCGHLNARLRVRLAAGSYSAFCGACLAEGPAAATAAEAEAAWDRRTGPARDALLAACTLRVEARETTLEGEGQEYYSVINRQGRQVAWFDDEDEAEEYIDDQREAAVALAEGKEGATPNPKGLSDGT